MVADLLHTPPPAATETEIIIRRIGDEAGLHDLIAVQTAVFERDHAAIADEFRSRLTDPTLGLYVAYSGGVPVAAGRLSLPPGRSFAGLWGGGTLPAFRQRGIYRQLVAARANTARTLGYRHLIVEARESSRPILQRLGFVPLTSVVGWILRPPGP
jgi:GNAT superfamily N-acetyltransferase